MKLSETPVYTPPSTPEHGRRYEVYRALPILGYDEDDLDGFPVHLFVLTEDRVPIQDFPHDATEAIKRAKALNRDRG